VTTLAEQLFSTRKVIVLQQIESLQTEAMSEEAAAKIRDDSIVDKTTGGGFICGVVEGLTPFLKFKAKI
jgi:hypothetical protein